jgi:phosphate uptake regulator
MTAGLFEDLGLDLARMARLVQTQLVTAMTAFFRRDTALAHKVTGKDDHVDNLLGFIEEKCFERITGEPPDSARSRRLRGVFRVALSLEKLGDYAVSIAEQAVHLSRLPGRPAPFDLAGPTRIALAALDEVITAFTEASADKAKDAGRCEVELDRQYRTALAEAFQRLGRGEDAPFIVTHLFVAKFLERIGDAILNIGETTLFILTGQRLKLHQYLQLEEMIGGVLATPPDPAGLDVRHIWGGISGALVSRLSVAGAGSLIWKEGHERKIDDEIRQLREWDRIAPGVVPVVRAQVHRDGRESFLRQFLDGTLLRDVYLSRPWEDKRRATRALLETVRDVWLATMRQERSRVDYVRQIRERLPELYAMHPELAALRGDKTRIFGIAHPSLHVLLEQIGQAEADLAAPVTVRVHGDFNTNNIVWDEQGERVHFIDVHRSGDGDYLQDIGVLLVSNTRTPIEDPRLVAELERVNQLVEDFAAEFARRVGDEAYGARLTLSRARSYITSARLATDPSFARELYLKGVRLLERAVELGGCVSR